MKIKLVTFAPHPNFGTCLQSYALNKVLRDMGHDVEFIYNGRETNPIGFRRTVKKIIKAVLPSGIVAQIKEKKPPKYVKQIENITAPSAPYILTLPNNYLLYLLSKLPFYERIYKFYKCRTLQWKKVYRFTFEDGNYKMKRLFIKSQYDKVVRDADLFITGSDQIWNPYCGGYNPMMFLEFVNDGTKCISYSSSISRPFLPDMLEQRIKNALQKFQYIAVREQKSVELLGNLLGRNDIRLVVDPTYLLSKEEWERFASHATIEFSLPEKYIFCYFVGSKRAAIYEQMVKDVKRYTGIDNVITLECYNRNLVYGDGLLYKDAGPYEWVYLLQHSSYVCMDSFHATIFSLIFGKEFVVALKNSDNETSSQNTRMYDILNRYGLSHKLYDKFPDKWKETIDHKKLQTVVEQEKRESYDFLVREVNE